MLGDLTEQPHHVAPPAGPVTPDKLPAEFIPLDSPLLMEEGMLEESPGSLQESHELEEHPCEEVPEGMLLSEVVPGQKAGASSLPAAVSPQHNQQVCMLPGGEPGTCFCTAVLGCGFFKRPLRVDDGGAGEPLLPVMCQVQRSGRAAPWPAYVPWAVPQTPCLGGCSAGVAPSVRLRQGCKSSMLLARGGAQTIRFQQGLQGL